jgi:hypothetical protein
MLKLYGNARGAAARAALALACCVLASWIAGVGAASSPVEVIEACVPASRPSWENNLNWWMDGNPVVDARIAEIPACATPGESASSADRQPLPQLALIALVASALLARSTTQALRPRRDNGRLMHALNVWSRQWRSQAQSTNVRDHRQAVGSEENANVVGNV